MSLQKQTLDLQITGGMNEKADLYTSTIPDLLSNCRYTKTGSLAKRPGSTCLVPSTNRNRRSNLTAEDAGTPTMLCQVGSELLRAGAGNLDRVYSTNASYGLVWRDRVSSLAATRRAVASSVWAGPSIATNRTVVAVFYIAVSASRYQPRCEVFDAATGERIIDPVELDNATANTLYFPAVVVIGGFAYCMWGDGVIGTRVASVNLVSGSVGTTTLLTAASAAFDVASDGTAFYLAYPQNALGANRMTVAQWTPTGASTYTAGTTINFGGADATLQSPAICRLASGSFSVGYGCNIGGGGTTGYRVSLVTSTLGAVTWGPTTALAPGVPFVAGWLSGGICESPTTPDAIIVAAASLETGAPGGVMWTCVSSGGTAATARSAFGAAQLWTKPFSIGTTPYMGIWLNHSDVSGFYVWRLNEWTGLPTGDTYHVEATIAPQAAYPIGSNATFLLVNNACSVAFPAAGTALAPALTGGNLAAAGIVGPAAELVTLSSQPTIGLEAAGGGAFTGGVPACYDGSKCSEFGFFYPPPSSLFTATATAGAGLSAGTYAFVAVYSYKDELGRVHRSQVSRTKTATAGGGASQITVVVPHLQVSNRSKWATRERCVHVEIYWATPGTTTFSLAWVGRNDFGLASSTVVFGGGGAGFVTGGPLLYTTGGIKEMVSPPSGTCAWVANQRLWLGGTDDDSVWFTDEFVAEEPPTFRDGFYLPAWEGGRVVAGAALDDKVVVFKQSSIWYTFGDGPDSTGTGSFASFRSLASDVGCVDPRSVVQVPDGILFQSKDGLCLLTRSLQVTRIGKPVEDSAGATSSPATGITSAVAVPSLAEIRFSSAITSEARAVVYDYFHGNAQQPVWYRYTWTNPILTGASVPSISIFLQPAVGSTVTLLLDGSSSSFFVGEIVSLTDGGYYQVTALPAADQVTVRNLGWSGNAAAGATVAFGSLAPAGKSVASACLYGGLYTWIDQNGFVFQDSTSTFLDTATGYTSQWVTMTAKLSCWNPQKVQGLMRVYQVGVLGSRKTDCDMAVSLWFDYKTGTASQSDSFAASTLSGYTLDQVAVRPSTQKLQAIQVQFSDATPTGGTIGTGEGVRLAAVSLEVGIRSGLPRLPAGAKG